MLGLLKKIFGTAQQRKVKKYKAIVSQIHRCEAPLKLLSDEELRGKTVEFKWRLQEGESLDALLPEAYAVVKQTCARLCGTEVHVSGYDQRWDMIPYDVQLLGGIAMHQGNIAEMHTGEGKTLTATLPLYLNSLTGKPVHLVTTNDYLAIRDCQWVGSVLRWLGLTTASLTSTTSQHERKKIYACDVVYATAAELGFDYLRDNSVASRKEEQVQRGFYFAIVDETDSILIDEARTPLIISGPVPDSRQMYGQLKEGVDVLVRTQREICNRLATEARKSLEKMGLFEGPFALDKANRAEFESTMRKLWKVNRGMPQNKILKRVKENPDLRSELDKIDLHFHSDTNNKEKAALLAELLIVVDEKSHDYEITDKGIHEWQEKAGGDADDFTMLDLGDAYHQIDTDSSLSEEEKIQRKLQVREADLLRKEKTHNVRQLLRAHLMMEKDVDYIVQEGKVVIIDAHTGRAMAGRRFSDGLHQAIEAKEGVVIEQETQTYATVTLQNYFRLYEKLSGMTGTAMTEASEFKEIYKLDVLEIPSHLPCIRKDFSDLIYMTEREKYNALLDKVRQVHTEGRPILLGTESVEVSEKLSRIFRANKLEHTVLNAKYHDKEAAIIAQAGQKGAITIATNMAGRGTDIKLGEGVAKLGGLFVIGASRHQSRRIDRQLRGRCARQGDMGSSLFFISFEDELMRLFASSRLNSLLQRLRPPEGESISSSILDRSIETAQKRVEQRNYTIRKHTLEYDDVMNKQRQEIYSFRNEILASAEVEKIAKELVHDVAAEFCASELDEQGALSHLMTTFPVTLDTTENAPEQILAAFETKLTAEKGKLTLNLDSTVSEALTADAMRSLMVRSIDKAWQEHLLTMDHLRSEVGMRAVGQRDPLMEFKQEAFQLFDTLSQTLREKIATDLFRFQIIAHPRGFLEQFLASKQLQQPQTLPSEPEGDSLVRKALQPKPIEMQGRNDLCPCGSGKKYKRCCGTVPA